MELDVNIWGGLHLLVVVLVGVFLIITHLIRSRKNGLSAIDYIQKEVKINFVTLTGSRYTMLKAINADGINMNDWYYFIENDLIQTDDFMVIEFLFNQFQSHIKNNGFERKLEYNIDGVIDYGYLPGVDFDEEAEIHMGL